MQPSIFQRGLIYGFCLFGLLVLLSACGKSSSPNPTTQTGTGSSDPNLVGTWVTSCAMDNSSEFFWNQSLTFDGTNLTSKFNFYEDAACTSLFGSDSNETAQYTTSGTSSNGQTMTLNLSQSITGLATTGSYQINGNTLLLGQTNGSGLNTSQPYTRQVNGSGGVAPY
jgi:hypothetical protein